MNTIPTDNKYPNNIVTVLQFQSRLHCVDWKPNTGAMPPFLALEREIEIVITHVVLRGKQVT